MIGDCMKRQVASVSPGTTVLGAARLVVEPAYRHTAGGR